MFINKSDGEPAMKALKDAAAKAPEGVERISQESPVGDHQANCPTESTVRTLKAQMTATRFALESRLGQQLALDDPILTWIPTVAGDTITRFRKGSDCKTPWERERGRTWAGDPLEFGERFFMKEAKERASGAVKRDWEPSLIEAGYLGQHARTGAMTGNTTDGIVCGRLWRRLPEAELGSDSWQDLKGVPWDLRPTGVPAPEIDHLKMFKNKGKQPENGTQEPKKKTARRWDPGTLEEKKHTQPQGDKELHQVTYESDAKLDTKSRAAFESQSSDRIAESDVAEEKGGYTQRRALAAQVEQ